MAGDVGVIAIDGPAAAGKTVVGRALARRLGFKYLDTGVMYRAITWLALQLGVSTEDWDALGQLAQSNPIQLKGEDSDLLTVGSRRVGTEELRDPEVDQHVSLVAQAPAVRRALVRQQQCLAAEGGIVMVGRDIGTVVLPKADLKVFLSASAEERARRRWLDLTGQGHRVELSRVLKETVARDELDSQRADSPLTPAADAVRVVTDGLSIEQTVEHILEQVRNRTGVSHGCAGR